MARLSSQVASCLLTGLTRVPLIRFSRPIECTEGPGDASCMESTKWPMQSEIHLTVDLSGVLDGVPRVPSACPWSPKAQGPECQLRQSLETTQATGTKHRAQCPPLAIMRSWAITQLWSLIDFFPLQQPAPTIVFPSSVNSTTIALIPSLLPVLPSHLQPILKPQSHPGLSSSTAWGLSPGWGVPSAPGGAFCLVPGFRKLIF